MKKIAFLVRGLSKASHTKVWSPLPNFLVQSGAQLPSSTHQGTRGTPSKNTAGCLGVSHSPPSPVLVLSVLVDFSQQSQPGSTTAFLRSPANSGRCPLASWSFPSVARAQMKLLLLQLHPGCPTGALAAGSTRASTPRGSVRSRLQLRVLLAGSWGAHSPK